MTCIPIIGPTFKEMEEQIERALPHATMLEIRLDYLQEVTPKRLQKIKRSLPWLFTTSSEERAREFAPLLPEYMDVPPSLLSEMRATYPQMTWIHSYHNTSFTPDLESLLEEMKQVPADLYKIACKANSTLDTLKMVHFASKNGLLGISMGEKGVLSRLLGHPWNFVALSPQHRTAEGQLTIEENALYAPSGNLYGLIGSVEKSLSHTIHNPIMKKRGAFYVKMEVSKEELGEFLFWARKLPFKGLSVTMPLKEAVLPYLDEIDPMAERIGAVNTLLFKEGRIKGYNTDGVGALNALEKKICVAGKRIVVVGAGGAARAIVYEALQRGATVTLLNRSVDKSLFGIQALALETSVDYDILINTTPHPLPLSNLLEKRVVMEIKTFPKYSPLLLLAKERGCTCVFGHEMFVEQALGQYQLWELPHIGITGIASK